MLIRDRFRYRLFLTIPLSGVSEDGAFRKGLFLGLYDEVFVAAGRNTTRNLLDQNRLYAALGWRFDMARNVQLGYLHHYVLKGGGPRAESNHTLQLAMRYNRDLRDQ